MKSKYRKGAHSLLCRIFLLFVLGLTGAPQLFATLRVGHLRTEAVENPVGIDVEKPTFSWTMENNDERGVMQTAYEINVFGDASRSECIWSSGKTESEACIDIPYGGNALKASTRYYWSVTVWDNKGNEAVSTENAWFETGLLGEGWHGAKWIKATDTPLHDNGKSITRYSVETDFEIENLAAGVIFGAKDDRNYFMWQVNMEAGYPRFRPHGWQNGTASCFAEIDLRSKINVALHKTYHLRIVVDGNKAETYIDDVLIDTRTNPYGGDYGYGQFGIRQDRALNNYNDLESAYFDNFTVTDLSDEKEEILIREEFASGTENPFTAGSIKSGRLYVQTAYAWYGPKSQDIYDLEMDFLIERDNAGIIFSAYNADNLHLWSINVRDQSYPILRRHHKVNGKFTSTDVNLGAFFTKAQLTGSRHHLKISVKPGIIATYIDDRLVDTYNDTSGTLHNGGIGFRAYFDKTMNEIACYDNVKVVTYSSTQPESEGTVTFFEDFNGAGHAFNGGVMTVKDNEQMLSVSSAREETCVMQINEKGIPVFRKAFTTDGKIKSAKIYATAMGVYDLFVNGSRVGQLLDNGRTRYDELKPGWTDYRKEVFYMSYDVTNLMQDGRNAIGAQVSNGWWGGAIARGVYGNPSLGFIAQLRIEYEDGRIEYITTDTDWICSTCGPVMYGDIYNGESYDARRDYSWASPEFDTSDWCYTVAFQEFTGNIVAHQGPTVQIRESLQRTPQSITVYDGTTASGSAYGMIHVSRKLNGTDKLVLKAGETAIFDLGQNMAGWIRFTVKGENSTRLRFRFGEMLNDKGDSNRGDDGPGGSLYTYNLRTADATLYYTMRGTEEGETFHPSTSFFGFRYCEVTTTHDVEIISLVGQVVGSAIEEGASFETSHADVNQLYSNIMWGQRSNFLSIPTDCPQRDERLGWTGDTQIFARTASYNADVRAFYHKWMRDMRNSQRNDGAYPDIAPYCNFWGYGTAAWGDAGIIVPWTVFQMYGDKRILEDNYASMSKYMGFLAAQSGGGFTYNGGGTSTGDWLAYEAMDARYVSVCYYAYVAQLMSKIAAVLSETEADAYHADMARYNELYENIKKEFQTRYLYNGLPTITTQTSYLLALKFDLLPEASREKALSLLRAKIADNGYKLSTGFVGTGILNQTLSQFGQDDLAYDLLLQRQNPSWLYSVDQGATTIWERWDSYTIETGFNKHPWNMNSFNHYAYGVVAEWMFRYVGGIEADEAQPGFKHIILQPTPDYRDEFPSGQERITHASASHRSAYGIISSAWNYKEDGRISYTATVPANTTATLYLPVLENTDDITEGGKPLKEAEGVTLKGIVNGKAVIELQSGTYEFNTEKGNGNRIEETVSSDISVRPCPFHNELNVTCTGNILRMAVTGSNGQTMHMQDHGAPINTSSWSPGIYVVDVATTDNRYTVKAVKQ